MMKNKQYIVVLSILISTSLTYAMEEKNEETAPPTSVSTSEILQVARTLAREKYTAGINENIDPMRELLSQLENLVEELNKRNTESENSMQTVRNDSTQATRSVTALHEKLLELEQDLNTNREKISQEVELFINERMSSYLLKAHFITYLDGQMERIYNRMGQIMHDRSQDNDHWQPY